MGTGYTRNDTANNIADGNVINASDLDGEFDAIQSAFNATTGHSHDGTTGEGPQIDTAGLADDAVTGAKIDSTTTITAAGFSGPLTGDVTGTASNAALLDSLDSTQFLRSDAADTKTAGDLSFADSVKAIFGAGSDLQIYHDASASYVSEQGTGNLKILGTNLELKNAADNANYMVASNGGSVQLYNNGAKKFETTSSGIDVTGTVTFDGGTTSADLNFGDNDKAVFGAGNDLQIYHDGSNSYIADVGTGGLYFRASSYAFNNAANTETITFAQEDGAVSLYYDGAAKLATKTDGVDITGELQADSLDIDGAGDITGNLTLGGNLDMSDNDKILLGTGDDLQIYHDGSTSFIDDTGTGNLVVKTNGGGILLLSGAENLAKFISDGASELYYDNSKKLETTSTGIDVTGDVLTDTLTLDNGASDWKMRVVSNNLIISYAGTDVFKLDTTGTLTVTNDIVSEGTI